MSENSNEASSYDARDAVLQRWSQTFRSQTASIARIAPSIASRHDAQRAWGYEIEGLARQVAVAKSQYNALALPCLLPTEILVNIFKFWKEIDPIVRRIILASSGDTSILRHGWLSATAVCQHFRAVALGHAAFWSTLKTDTPWELFLARSRDSPLCIHQSGINESKYLPIVIANLGRIRELFLSYPSPHATLELFKRDAPELRFLSVKEPRGHYSFPRDFLLNHSPSLRTLRLSGVGIPSNISAPLSLRYLKLTRCRTSSSCSFEELLSCLRNMPLLEEFTSIDSLPEGGDMGSPSISLPHLRHLSLNEDAAGPLYLWSSLTASAFYHVELTLQTMEHGDMVHSDLITAIRGHLGQPWCPSYTTFILGYNHWEDGHVFSFIVQSAPLQIYDPEEAFDGSYHKLAITSYPEERDLERPVVSLFPIEPVHTFVLREYILMNSSVMAQTLHPFIALETIEATGSATVGKLLLSFITASHAAQTEQTSAQHAYLPALHTLSFKNVNFDSNVPEDARIPYIYEEAPLHDLLKLALHLRASGAARIRTLTMQSCFTKSESWVQSCSVYVDALDWKNACGEGDVKTWEEYLDEEYD